MARKAPAWDTTRLAPLAARGQEWLDLLGYAVTADKAKPSDQWLDGALPLLSAVGMEAFEAGIVDLFGELVRLGEDDWHAPLEELTADQRKNADWYDGLRVSDAVKGLFWMVALLPATPQLASATAAMLEAALHKVPNRGPMDVKVANASAFALGAMDSPAALGQLARLSAKVTFKTTLKQIDAALTLKAAAKGMTREEIAELGVPTYGLTDVGFREVALGDVTATVQVTGRTVRLSFRNAAGRTVKSAPAAVRANHPAELQELKREVKDISKMISAQAERLDRQFLNGRIWEYRAWKERYLDHPLTGTLARRVIWTVDGVAVCWHDGALRTVDGVKARIADGAQVRLWHPIGHGVEEVKAWRAFVEDRGIVQPFKQAHREVYLLTPAEEDTRSYSNRFAGHILRQHQYHALAATRGWRDSLRLDVDDAYPPTSRLLPKYGLRAEYWVEGIGDYEDGVLGSYAFIYLRTDRVRFCPIDAEEVYAHASGGGYQGQGSGGAGEGIPLSDVDPLVFSEIMRDVDLFVGVSSVGGDPTWSDGGPEGRHAGYWWSYSFGELSTTAAARRDLLARLIPRLAIAPRCRITDRFLEVDGSLHTYKIHFNSGNILMSPDDRYLCIVSSPRAASLEDPLRLPFDGDRTLSIILSKAVMLANDSAITDETILAQIR